MPYSISEPPERIKKLPSHAQKIWISAFNSAYKQYNKDEEKANKVAWVAVKRVYKKEGEKWTKKKNSFSFPICFSEAKIEKEMEIHILPVGEWEHALYGDIKIKEEDIEEFVQHFDQGIRKGVTITEGHAMMQELPAVGWFKKLINKNDKGLWGLVEWTDKGRELLQQKAYKYFSPEFFTVYEDPETHKLYNNILTGGALTNSPYFKDLQSIVMSELVILEQFKNMKEKIKDDKKELSEKESKELDFDEDDENDEDDEDDEEETELSDIENAKIVKEENIDKIKENVVDRLIYREPVKNLSEKIVYQVINSTSDIKIEEKTDLSEFKKELLRAGTWKHGAGKDGILEITKETLKSIVKNFKDKVLDNVFVPLGHPTTDDPSSNIGEVVDLSIEGINEDKLVATIDVKEKGIVEKIKNGLIKCISASLTENYSRKDTGEDVGPTLFHAALVSEPYIKGMAPFIPLSEDMKDSTIISIMNMEEPLTLQDLSIKIENMEKVIEKIKLNEPLADETKDKETEPETKIESPEVDVKIEEEEEVKVEEEETKPLEDEPEADEDEDEGVALAAAEKMFATLLSEGRVTPAEKGLLVPLLASNQKIELSDGEIVNSKIQLFEYLKKQPSKFSLSEDGKMPDNKRNSKKVEMSADVQRAADKIAKALNLSEEEKVEMLSEVAETKRNK